MHCSCKVVTKMKLDGKRLDFDFKHCKGCGICVKVCPFDAIDFVKEEK